MNTDRHQYYGKEPLLEQINDYRHSRSPSKAALRHECTIELVLVGPVHIGAPVAAGTEGSALRSCD